MPPTRSYARKASARSTTVRRAAAEAAANKPSIRLTVKAPPSKLRQALNSSDGDDTPEPPVRNARSTRNPRTVIEPDTDEDMDEDEDAEEEDEDTDMVDTTLREEFDEDEDSEEEEEEDEEDSDMEDATPKPPPANSKKAKIDITVSAPPTKGALKSVEAKELEMDDMSDLDSDDDLEGEDDEEEEDEEEEEEEEEEGEEGEEGAEGEEGEEDDVSDSDGGGSGSATPDLTKLTRRQRAAYEQELEGGLMALSNEAQKKKHLTAEEHAMRRTEMARRRKNLSEKRNEEEKMDTINKLLKKPAPKRRTRAEMIAAASAAQASDTPGAEDGEEGGAHPLWTRWVNSSSGSRLGVPSQWMDKAVGETLGKGWTRPPPRMLVEEV
ncbi:hypothetical protein ANO11243_042900 [Dothideomycetidae sp. 11243]|nr:hypothetical protein ANO11243_042900 [fungal sp. No.11243]